MSLQSRLARLERGTAQLRAARCQCGRQIVRPFIVFNRHKLSRCPGCPRRLDAQGRALDLSQAVVFGVTAPPVTHNPPEMAS